MQFEMMNLEEECTFAVHDITFTLYFRNSFSEFIMTDFESIVLFVDLLKKLHLCRSIFHLYIPLVSINFAFIQVVLMS